MPPTRPASDAGRRLAVGAALALGLGACRADSIVTPAQPTCDDPSCEAATLPPTTAPIVIAPLEDAVARIVPHMMDRRASADLRIVLGRLRSELLAGRIDASRIQLARSYDALDLAERRLSSSEDGSGVLDLADLSAVRLALVPAANALGVATR
jgi:hypothetical protein